MKAPGKSKSIFKLKFLDTPHENKFSFFDSNIIAKSLYEYYFHYICLFIYK